MAKISVCDRCAKPLDIKKDYIFGDNAKGEYHDRKYIDPMKVQGKPEIVITLGANVDLCNDCLCLIIKDIAKLPEESVVLPYGPGQEARKQYVVNTEIRGTIDK